MDGKHESENCEMLSLSFLEITDTLKFFKK